jgi:hypothetical protein
MEVRHENWLCTLDEYANIVTWAKKSSGPCRRSVHAAHAEIRQWDVNSPWGDNRHLRAYLACSKRPADSFLCFFALFHIWCATFTSNRPYSVMSSLSFIDHRNQCIFQLFDRIRVPYYKNYDDGASFSCFFCPFSHMVSYLHAKPAIVSWAACHSLTIAINILFNFLTVWESHITKITMMAPCLHSSNNAL